MKKKKILSILSLIAVSALILSSCVNKKDNPTTTDITPVTDITTNTDTAPITGSTKPTTPTEPEPTLPPQTDVTIDPIEEESLINAIYEDFNKATLPKTYVPFVKEVFSSSLSLNAEEQKSIINSYSCISAKGVQIIDGEETPFLIDSALKLSEDESYIGFILTPIVVNMSNYVNDLLAYEEEQYGEISTPTYYVFQNQKEKAFIISIESKDGSNRDLVVINESGIGSYINYSNNDFKFETVLEEKNKISSEDLDILNNLPCVRYNNNGCLFRITDYSITNLVIPGSYRTIPFNDLEIKDLDKCENLTNVSLNGSNKYKVIDGILYNKDLTELLYYPKAKEADTYEILDSVTEIREGAFKNLNNLKELIYSDGIYEIKDNEFENSNLEKIIMNESISIIGKEIFKGCSNLKEIYVPFVGNNIDDIKTLSYFYSTESNDKMNEIEINDTKYYVSSLEKIDIILGDIDDKIFEGFSTLKEIKLPDSLIETNINFGEDTPNIEKVVIKGITKINDGMFEGCTNLIEIDIDNITEIGEYAFSGCKNLEIYSFDNVLSLGEGAFNECEKLTNFDFTNIEIIEIHTFSGCISLEEIDIKDVKEIKEGAFRDCTNLTKVNSNNKLEKIGLYAFYEDINLVRLENLDNVISIGDYSFYNCIKYTKSEYPKLETIGKYSFYNCIKLNAVYMEKLEIIEEYAFVNCEFITNMYFDSVKTIGAYAFKNTIIDDIYFENAITINDYAFEGSELTFIYAPKVTSVGNVIFKGCSQLRSIFLNSVTNISGRLTDQTELSNSAVINLGITSINDNNITDIKLFKNINLDNLVSYSSTLSFNGNKNIKSVSLNKFTGNVNFGSCSNLETVNFPEVTTITSFQACSTLKSISLPKVTSVPGYAFSGCTSLTSVSLPLVTKIGDNNDEGKYAFSGCTSLTTVDIPKATTIGRYAFYNCTALKNITLPKVTTIGRYAFNNCTILASITLGASTMCSSNTGGYFMETFNLDNNHVLIIKVPSNLLSTYKAEETWKYYMDKGYISFQTIS